jgi:hypothetical protein
MTIMAAPSQIETMGKLSGSAGYQTWLCDTSADSNPVSGGTTSVPEQAATANVQIAGISSRTDARVRASLICPAQSLRSLNREALGSVDSAIACAVSGVPARIEDLQVMRLASWRAKPHTDVGAGHAGPALGREILDADLGNARARHLDRPSGVGGMGGRERQAISIGPRANPNQARNHRDREFDEEERHAQDR